MKAQSFLTVLFALLLLFNKHKWVVAEAGRKSVCEQRYHGLHVGREIRKLIEKLVSVKSRFVRGDNTCASLMFLCL